MMLLLCSVLGAPKRIDSYFTQFEPPIRAALPPSPAPPLLDDFTYALPLGITDNHSWLGSTIQTAFPSLQKPRLHANLSEYCRLGRASRWWRQIALQAPPRSLSRDEVVFSLLTTDRSSPGASEHLQIKGACARQTEQAPCRRNASAAGCAPSQVHQCRWCGLNSAAAQRGRRARTRARVHRAEATRDDHGDAAAQLACACAAARWGFAGRSALVGRLRR